MINHALNAQRHLATGSPHLWLTNWTDVDIELQRLADVKAGGGLLQAKPGETYRGNPLTVKYTSLEKPQLINHALNAQWRIMRGCDRDTALIRLMMRAMRVLKTADDPPPKCILCWRPLADHKRGAPGHGKVLGCPPMPTPTVNER